MRKWFGFFLIFMFFFGATVFAQHVPSKERGDKSYRRTTDIAGNLVRTTVWNNGTTGRTKPGDGIPYEWPKNTGKMYLAETGILIGAEVVDEDGQIRHITAVHSRTSPSGKSWQMEPVPEYANPNSDKIAMTTLAATEDDRATWPPFWPDKLADENDPGWPGSWNGYFGKNQFNADLEMFYRMSDDSYDRYNYYPDTTDYSRRGLGLLVDVRVMQWSQILVNDVVFILYDIKNDGTKDLDKAAVTLFVFDLVGGDGDSQDDHSDFDLLNDIAWCTDTDGRGNQNFGDDQVGVVATSFLETPGNPSDGIDNDGDGEDNSPVVTETMIADEDPTNLIDDNGNGLIDENKTHIAFADQKGVGFRDHIDNDGDGEPLSPVVTDDMTDGEIVGNGKDDNNNGLYDEDATDVGKAYRDWIDNNGDGEDNSPVVTQEMIDAAASQNGRYVTANGITLYDLGPEDLGKKYADGIDNDGDGAIDEMIDEGIDEMIDERRDNFIDDDGDWDPVNDDVGLDGNPLTYDTGQGDGVPTSGAGTGFPGEPNIDVTDVSESDQLGLTNVQYQPAGNFHTEQDEGTWSKWMIPGKFWDTSINTVNGDWDLFVSSGLFPLKAGQRARISMAVNLGQDKKDALRNKEISQKTYDLDYQFAKAPILPVLKAIPGDGKVTLYWDDKAEKSYDKFMQDIGAEPYDFEGYRIYKATDPAFEDAYSITDADGNLTFYKPVAQFDLKNGITGLDSLGINGAHFNLGSDTGLRHSWVDEDVINGQTYYYAVTAYDRGAAWADIPPSETPIPITVEVTGEVKMGTNVQRVIPDAPSAGYVPPTLVNIEKPVQGTTTGRIMYDIVDPQIIPDNHKYRITFRDTLLPRQNMTEPDTLKTLDFSLFDVTFESEGKIDTLILNCPKLKAYQEIPMTDGFRLILDNEDVIELNQTLSGWNDDEIMPLSLKPFQAGFLVGFPNPKDYKIVFGDVGMDTSIYLRVRRIDLNPKSVNFTVYNMTDSTKVKFAFWETDGDDGIFTASYLESDVIVFMEENAEGELSPSWRFKVVFDTLHRNPAKGDTAYLYLKKPFLSNVVFEFTTRAPYVDKEMAKTQLDRIKVVPNPYVATAIWEGRNFFTTGRGPRSIHFNHLPRQCTIRIFTVSGELVDTIEHNSPIDDGSAEWDVLTRDNLTVSYGIYIYHVDAPGIGEKIGKFAIIK